MPTYEYECQNCGHRFETFQNMSDAPLEECKKCKGALKRLIFGGTGVIFKGSGFYINDSVKTAKKTKQNIKSDSKKAEKTVDKPEKKAKPSETKKEKVASNKD